MINKTYAFIWANTWIKPFEYDFIIAIAPTINEARMYAKKQIEIDLDFKKSMEVLEGRGNEENLKKMDSIALAKIEAIYKYDPSHILTNGMAKDICRKED